MPNQQTVIVADYATHRDSIQAIRHEVFVLGQNVSRDDEIDGRDEICRHALVLSDGKPVATGRVDLIKGGKIGRVAVVDSHRRLGLGSSVMQTLEAIAKRGGQNRVWLHAQLSAVVFYTSLNYSKSSEEFTEAGIVHIEMEKRL